MTIILVGIPGSGKSTVLDALKSAFATISVVNYGEVMLEEAALFGLERDALRKMPIEKQQEIGLRAANKIAKVSEQKSQSHHLTIVDTHACVKTPVGYYPGLPLKILTTLQPKALVMVHASPHIIVERRARDQTRKRDEENIAQLTLHQELTRAYLVSASALTGALLCLINNDSENIADNCKPLATFIKNFISFV